MPADREVLAQMLELESRLSNAERQLQHLTEGVGTIHHGARHARGLGDEVPLGIFEAGTLQVERLSGLNFNADFSVTPDLTGRYHTIDWVASGMLKTAGAGYFVIPTGPAIGVTVTSGAADAFNGTATQMIASTAAALYIVGFSLKDLNSAATYVQVAFGTGAAPETVVGTIQIDRLQVTGAGLLTHWFPLPFPIPVAASTRIAANTADSIGGLAWRMTLTCIAQADLVAI